MIPYGRQSISDDDIESVVQVLRSDLITQGPTVPLFEEVVAGYCGAKYGVATTNATSALHVACLALGLRRGDLVWTSPNTFAASANCALYCGANIDFVDIDPVTYNLSVASLRRKLEDAEKTGKLPKIVIPVHFAGQSCEMKEIATLSKYYGFRVLEDASHAIGGRYRGQPVGNCRYSDITVFSFHPVKIITTGEGGMITLNGNGVKHYEKLKELRSMGQRERYHHVSLGFNYRMNDIAATLGIEQLKKVNYIIERKNEIVKRYNASFVKNPLIKTPHIPDYATQHSWYMYMITLDESINRDNVVKFLAEEGIETRCSFPPMHIQPAIIEYMKDRKDSLALDDTFSAWQKIINLPIWAELSSSDQDFVIDAVNQIVRV